MSKLILILLLMLVPDNNQQSRKLGSGISVSSAQEACFPCVCGILGKGRIKGGNQVRQINKYPWIAAVNSGASFCGGSLINSKYVITAGHCVYGRYARDFTVSLMEHNLQVATESNIIRRRLVKVILHPSYNTGNLDNDIALLRLNQPVPVGVNPGMPNPVCLPRGGNSYVGTNALVIGWGNTVPNGQLSPVLKEVIVPVLTNSDCNRVYPGWVTPNKICAGIPQIFAGTLQGDSGGPLMTLENSKHTLIGIVSSGAPSLGTSIYTRVSRYLDWIAKHTADACPCRN